MKREIFETKEQYLTFKQQWANYFNNEARNLEMDHYGYKTRKLKAIHFFFYATACGKNPMKGIETCRMDTIEDIKWYLKRYQTKSEFFIPFKDMLTHDQIAMICERALQLLDNFEERRDEEIVEETKLRRMGAM